MPEGRVAVGGGEGAAGGVELADVLGEVPAIGVPGAVDLDGQRTGGDGLRDVPCDVPERGVMAAGEVDAGNLQIASINVALVERDAAIDAHLLVRAAAHRIVGAFHDRIAFTIREGHALAGCSTVSSTVDSVRSLLRLWQITPAFPCGTD